MTRHWMPALLICTALTAGCVVVPIPIPLGTTTTTTGGGQQGSAPVLRDDTLRSALAGRTLRGQGQVIQLAANGSTQLDLGWTQTTGTWRVSGDNLCMSATIPGAGPSESCASARIRGNQVTLRDPGNGPTVTYDLR